MKIVMINGSPKLGESTSGLLLDFLGQNLSEHEVQLLNINKKPLSTEQLLQVSECEALIFAFPLYIDSIPSHLLKQLQILEKLDYPNRPRVYCILNNGFFEGKQNWVALTQMKLWCEKTGLVWGQGMGAGAGEMISKVQDIPMGHGPNKRLGQSILAVAENIRKKQSGKDILICLNWPRSLWRWQASQTLWYPLAKKNGITKQEMYRKMGKSK